MFFSKNSTQLRIEIKRNGETKVSLSFPPKVLLKFETLLPDKARDLIRKRGIDIESLKQSALDNNFAAMELVSIFDETENKEIKVWLG